MDGGLQQADESVVASPLLGRLEDQKLKTGLPVGENYLERADCKFELDAEDAEAPLRRVEEGLSFAKRSVALLYGILRVPQSRAAVITIAWVILGVYMFTSVPWEESGEYYTLIDSMYVMAQIITTVGYGDMCAKTKGHLLFTSFYVLTAVMALSSIAGVVAENIVRGENELLQVALERIGDHVEEGFSKLPPEVQSHVQMGMEQLPDRSRLERLRQHLTVLAPSREVMAFLKALAIWVSFVVIWSLFFCFYPWEQRDFVEAFYMAIITLTTVGFGDKTPVTQGGKLFATVWMIGGVGAFANLLGKCATLSMIKSLPTFDEDTLEEVLESDHFKRSLADRRNPGGKPKVHRDEFIVFMLQKMDIVEEEIIAKLSHNFDQFDADGNGYLDEIDLKRGIRRLKRSPTA